MQKTKIQTAAVKFMICDLMQSTDDHEYYRKEMMDAHAIVADALGNDWSEWTAGYCVDHHLDGMEIALWPVANWDHFLQVARGELG